MAKTMLAVTLTVGLTAPNMVAAQEAVNNELNKNQAEVIQEQAKLTLQKALENVNAAREELDIAQKNYSKLSAEASEQNAKKDKLSSDIELHKKDLDNVDVPDTLNKLKESTKNILTDKNNELAKVTKEIDETNKAIDEAKATLTEKKEKKAELENKIIEMNNQYGELEDYAEKKAKVEALEEEKAGLENLINEITNTINELTADKTTKEEKVKNLDNSISVLNGEIANLQTQAEKTEAEYNQSKTAYEEALASQSATQEELETLKAQMTTKEAELEQIKATIADREAKLANAEKILAEQTAPDENEQKLQKRVDKAKEEVATLESDLKKAQDDLNNLNNEIANKDKEIAQAEAELKALNSDIEGLEKSINDLENSKSDKVKAYEEAVKARDAVSQYRTDFISIFDGHNANGYHMKDYMDWLTKTPVKDYKLKIVDEDLQRVFGKTEITVGELVEHPVFKADMEYGFSKEGLLRRLDLIDEGNRKRALDGKSALPVSYVLMLQSQLAAAINPLESTHTMAFHLDRIVNKTVGSENFATGASKPFEEWYTWEKAVYDYVREHYPTESPGEAAHAHAEEILKNVKPSVPGTGGYSLVGHYLNLVKSSHKTNGIGIAPEHTNWGKLENDYNRPSTMHHLNDENIAGDTVKTTDEVRAEIEKLSKELNPKWVELNKKVEEALNNLTADDKQVLETLKAKKAELESKQSKVEPKNEEIKKLNSEKKALESKKPALEEGVSDNKGYVEWAKGELAKAEKALAEYKEDHKPSQEVIDGLKNIINGYKAEIEQGKAKETALQNDIDTIKSRQAELRKVLDEAGVTDKENAMNEKKAELDRLTGELDSKTNQLKSMVSERTNLNNLIKELESKIAKSVEDRTAKSDRVNKIDGEIAGIALPNIDEAVYKDYKAAKTGLAKLRSDIEKLNSDISNKEVLVDELKANKQILISGIDKLRDELDKLNAIDLNDPSTFSLNPTVLAEYNRGELLKTELALLEKELEATDKVIDELLPKLADAKLILAEKQAEYEKHYQIYIALKAEEDAKIRSEQAKKAELERASNGSNKAEPNTGDSNDIGSSVAMLIGSAALASVMMKKKKEEE